MNISQNDLAAYAGIKLTVLNKAEQNLYTPPTPMLNQMAAVLKLNPEWLFFNQPPIFGDVIIAFANLSFSLMRKGLKFRQQITKDYINEIINYVVSIEEVSSGMVVNPPFNRDSYICLECCQQHPHFIILRVDNLFHSDVLKTLSENIGSANVVLLTQRGELFYSIFSDLYLREPTSENVTQLSRTAGDLREAPSADPRTFNLLKALCRLRNTTDIVTPATIRVDSNQYCKMGRLKEVNPIERSSFLRRLKNKQPYLTDDELSHSVDNVARLIDFPQILMRRQMSLEKF